MNMEIFIAGYLTQEFITRNKLFSGNLLHESYSTTQKYTTSKHVDRDNLIKQKRHGGRL